MKFRFILQWAKKRLYFLNRVYKVRISTQKIRQEMQARARATCPELAEATGLSLVTVHKEVKRLCSRGELRLSKETACRGGRPSPIYEYESRYARRMLLEVERSGAVMQVQLELADMMGHTLSRRHSVYAALEQESLDGMLDAALHRQKAASIALILPPTPEYEPLRTHLQQRYHCPVIIMNTAEALADSSPNTATLYLRQGEPPLCSLHRHGRAEHAGRLDLLPLPSAWETLDYTDRTMVEEMVARLLQIIVCTLAPERIVLHADFWTTRLTERIRFNTQSKLRGAAPPLHFRTCTAQAARAAVRTHAWRLH